jgi:hypothetical protein
MAEKIKVKDRIPVPKGIPNVKGKLSLDLSTTKAKELAWAYEKQGDKLSKSNNKEDIRKALESYQYAEYVYRAVDDIRAVRDVKIKRERTLASIGLPKAELSKIREAEEQTVHVLTPSGMNKTIGAVAAVTLFGSFVFLTSNITGNVIGNFDKVATGWIGGGLFALGIICAMFYIKNR